MKITFIILLARQLALLQEKKDLTRFSNVIQPTAHAGAMFVFYYILSKDAGSGLVYLFVFLCMAFAGGFALRWIFLGLGGAVGAFLAAWNLGLLRGAGTTASRSFSTTATSRKKKAGSRRAVCLPSARAS